MRCQYCNSPDSRVIDSRPAEDGNSIRRRRECTNCNRRFTTYEKIEMVPLLVIKKDNSREPFDSQKIRKGIVYASEKRPISSSQIDELVTKIEQSIYNAMESEVSSKIIGELVMEGLKELDQIAYVRFASVYRQFTDVSSFMDELTTLLEEAKLPKSGNSLSEKKDL
ncbi:MAG: transcriptional repressor NrdR [Clostridiales bacterium]|nr:transcriptional repressor NrdR [Clostridiales bacterium]